MCQCNCLMLSGIWVAAHTSIFLVICIFLGLDLAYFSRGLQRSLFCKEKCHDISFWEVENPDQPAVTIEVLLYQRWYLPMSGVCGRVQGAVLALQGFPQQLSAVQRRLLMCLYLPWMVVSLEVNQGCTVGFCFLLIFFISRKLLVGVHLMVASSNTLPALRRVKNIIF